MRSKMTDVRETKDSVYTMIDNSLVKDMADTLREQGLEVEVR